jgi:fused signal recognition particle receptor
VLKFFGKKDEADIDRALTKTRGSIFGQIGGIFRSSGINEDTMEELEDILISCDLGFSATNLILDQLRERSNEQRSKTEKEVILLLRSIVNDSLNLKGPDWLHSPAGIPLVILMVGVNGAGKTTTVAKLSKWYMDLGKSVIIGAGDTFRAAASEQLQSWGDKLSADVITHQQGSDPAAVAFDTIAAAKNRNKDVAIIDTAGRLQGKSNLMEELKKIHKITIRESGNTSVRVLLTIDATTGQNGISQASAFGSAVKCDGVFLSKLDGSAKGGIAIPIVNDLKLPIAFVGTGEQLDDIAVFDPAIFAKSLIPETST